MSLMDLLAKTEAVAPKVILKINNDPAKTHPHEKRKGYRTVSGWLENGDETFIVISDAEAETIPEKDGYADMSSVARIKKNRIGKCYLERIVPLDALNKVDFKNPFEKK